MYHARSGGLRTVVDTLGRGYAAAGHDRVLIVPGTKRSVAADEHGTVITLPGTPVTGGYRMILRAEKVLGVLAELNPDSIEVSDKATLASAGPWARARGVRAVLFSHERLGEMVANRTRSKSESLQKAALRWTRRVVAGFDEVVATSAFGERELALAGATNIRRVPLGVDLETFRPGTGPGSVSARTTSTARPDIVRLVYAGRLSSEKNPQAAIEAVRVLRSRGVDARLDVYGSGPHYGSLCRRAKGLPVTFHGHIAQRANLAKYLAHADLVLAPAACETFGLAALEALACGVAVVAAAGSGAAELVAQTQVHAPMQEPIMSTITIANTCTSNSNPPPSRGTAGGFTASAQPGAGIAAPPTGAGLAGGVLELLVYPARERAAAARARASQFPWSASVGRMLAIHEGAARAADDAAMTTDAIGAA
jgi:alpha-1,6-mannosyltransferase